MEPVEFGVAGGLRLAHGPASVEDRDFGGPQQRLATVMLLAGGDEAWVVERLAEELWPSGLPDRWRPALRGLVSRVRRLLTEVGVDGESALVHRGGGYVLELPELVVDVDVARARVAAARRALEDGLVHDAAELAGTARAVVSRPVLPGVDNPWLDSLRQQVAADHLEALVVLGTARSQQGRWDSARVVLDEALAIAPLREDVWRALMTVEVQAGNTAAALRRYEQCRARLAEDLGVDPSPATQQVYLDVLASIPDPAAPEAAGATSGERRPPEAGDDVVPYVGLRPFDVADSRYFFGRDAAVQRLVEVLATQGSAVVVGPSGSGKSSVVRAGLLPALAKAAIPDADTWPVAVLEPGAAPLTALAAALGAVSVADADDPGVTTRLAARMAEEPEALREVVRETLESLSADRSARLVLVVDQAEELFTLASAEERTAFLTAVRTLVRGAPAPAVVVMTLRADFFALAARHPDMAELLGRAQYLLPPMSAAEVEAAVLGPARAVGVRFGPGVLGRILGDVLDQPGMLPLLQFSLVRTWESRESDLVDLRAYERSGGVRGAVRDTAEAALDGLDPEAVAAVRRLLLRLVAIDEEHVTRRRESLERLTALDGPTADLVDRLVSARLLTTSRDPIDGTTTVELAHEAVTTAWPRLRAWVSEAREQLLEVGRLRSEAAEWLGAGRDPGLLLSGRRLAAARVVVADDVVALSAGERAFVEAGVEAAHRQEEQERARERESQRSLRFRRRASVAGAALLAVLLVAVVSAAALRERADVEEAAARQARLVATAAGVRDTRPDLSLLLSVEAWRRDPGPAQQRTLLEGLNRMKGVDAVWAGARHGTGGSSTECVTWADDGVVVIQPSRPPDDALPMHPGPVTVVDLDRHEVLQQFDSPLNCWAHRSPPGVTPTRWVGTDAELSAVYLLDDEGEVEREVAGHTMPFFLPDGTVLARPEGTDPVAWVRIDPSTGRTSRTSLAAARAQPVPGADLLWLAQNDRELNEVNGFTGVSVVDATTFETVVDLGERPMRPIAATSADGRYLALVASDGMTVVVDTRTTDTVAEVDGSGVTAVAMDADGTRLYTASPVEGVVVHSVPGGAVVAELPGLADSVQALQPGPGNAVVALETSGLVLDLDPSALGQGTRMVQCCADDNATAFTNPHGEPNPITHLLDADQGTTTAVDAVTGEVLGGTTQLFELMADGGAGFGPTRDGAIMVIQLPFHEYRLELDGSVTDLGAPLGEDFEHLDGEAPEIADWTDGTEDYLVVTIPLEGSWDDTGRVLIATVDEHGQLAEAPQEVRLEHAGSIWVGAVQGGMLKVTRTDAPDTVDVYDRHGVRLGTFTHPKASPRQVNVTPDARYGIVVAEEGTTWLVDVATDERRELPVRGRGIMPLTPSRAIITTRQGALQLWDLDAVEYLGTVAELGGGNRDRPIAPASGDELWIPMGGWVQRISLDPVDWADRACALAGRALTEQEWTDLVADDEPYVDTCGALSAAGSADDT
jgi:DNA-binding SARP family transcriptional activator